MAKEKNKDPFAPGHHMGKRFGYEVLANGDIQLAPGLSSEMDSTRDEELGLRMHLNASNEFFTKTFTAISKRQKNWWERIRNEIEIKLEDNWAYTGNGILRKQKKKEEENAGPS